MSGQPPRLGGMQTTEQRFWHGGAPGLSVGDRIIPRSRLDDACFDKWITSRDDPTNTDRVYITTDVSFATGWAIRYANTPYPGARRGAIYEVVPDGEIVRDPDFPAEAGSWYTSTATIVGIRRPKVTGPDSQRHKRIGRFLTWTDGTPTYTDEGFLRAAPEWRAAGVVDADLRRFGRWVAFENLAATEDGLMVDTTDPEEERQARMFFREHVRNNRIVNMVDPERIPRLHSHSRPASEVRDRYLRSAQSLLDKGVQFLHSDLRQDLSSVKAFVGRWRSTSRVQSIRPEHHTAVIASYGGRPIGLALVEFQRYAAGHAVFVHDLVVDDGWRGMGVGTVLAGMLPRMLENTLYTAGPCSPEHAHFLNRSGYTVLTPGSPLPFTLAEPEVLLAAPDNEIGTCWFYLSPMVNADYLVS